MEKIRENLCPGFVGLFEFLRDKEGVRRICLSFREREEKLRSGFKVETYEGDEGNLDD